MTEPAPGGTPLPEWLSRLLEDERNGEEISIHITLPDGRHVSMGPAEFIDWRQDSGMYAPYRVSIILRSRADRACHA